MDNINKELVKSSERTDLQPMFNFNSDGIWTQDDPHTRLDSVTKIRHWSEMVKRMGTEQG